MMRSMLASGLAAVLAVGCAHDASPRGRARTPYEELEARTPAILEAIDRLAASLRAAGGECRQLAAALRGFGDRHAAALAELAEWKRRLSADERERWGLDHSEDAARLEPVMAAVRPCAGDPEVDAALATAGFRDGR